MSILDKLKKYFETTPREQIEKDWADCAKYDNVGPKVDDFIKVQQEKSLLLNKDLVDNMSDEELDELMREYDKLDSTDDTY